MRITHFHSQSYTISQSYQILIHYRYQCRTKHPELLKKNARFSFSEQFENTTIKGVITQVCFELLGPSDNWYGVIIRLESPLALLKQRSRYRTYVNTAITEILQDLFSSLSWQAGIHYHCQFKKNNKLAMIRQANETDYDFFQRLLAEQQLFYRFAYSEQQLKLLITDDIHLLNNSSVIKSVSIIPSSGLENSQQEFFAYQTQRTLPPETKTSNNDYHTQPQVVTIKTQRRDLQLADRLRFSDPAMKQHGVFRIIQIDYQGSQGSIDQAAPTTQLPFQATLTLIPATDSYWLSHKQQQQQTPLYRAKVFTRTSVSNVDLDDKGRYLVRYTHDSANYLSTEKQSPSKRLPLMQLLTGPEHGMHFPLQADSEILIGHHWGNINQAMIVGVLPVNANHSPVNKCNSNQYCLKSHYGHQLLFDDHHNAKSIRLTTATKPLLIELQATKQLHQISLSAMPGNIILSAKENIHFQCRNCLQYNIKKNFRITVDQHFFATSDKSTITHYSGKGYQLKAKKNVTLLTEKNNLQLQAKDSIHIKSKDKIQLRAQTQKININATAGEIAFNAANKLQFYSHDGELNIVAGESQIRFTNAGSIKICGRKIVITASTINLSGQTVSAM